MPHVQFLYEFLVIIYMRHMLLPIMSSYFAGLKYIFLKDRFTSSVSKSVWR